jgi:hypothetical protein
MTSINQRASIVTPVYKQLLTFRFFNRSISLWTQNRQPDQGEISILTLRLIVLTMISPSSAFGMSLTEIFLMATVSPVVQLRASGAARTVQSQPTGRFDRKRERSHYTPELKLLCPKALLVAMPKTTSSENKWKVPSRFSCRLT